VPETDRRLGLLCVVSGPSGSGKTTLCKAARREEGCQYSISCTTRSPRSGEVDGEHYHFLTPEEFLARVEEGKFLEHATVHGNLYGTLRSSVEELLRQGRDVVMDIDVQGAALVRACEDPLVKKCLVDVFVLPPSIKELASRLSGRGTETQEQLDLRMSNSIEEMAQWQDYGYTVLSASVRKDFERFRAILHAERQRSSRLDPKIASEIQTL